MNVDGELIVQYNLILDDEAMNAMRDLAYKLSDKIKEVGLRKKEFTETEVELIHQLCDLFEPPE